MRTRLLCCALTASLAAGVAGAADPMQDLAIFKSGGIQSGLWRMQVLESSNPEMQRMVESAGKMSICADIAKEMGKSALQEAEQSCTSKVLSNKPNSAEVEASCADGDRSLIKLVKENERSYTAEIQSTPTSGEPQRYKMRYTYEGECKGDSMIQLDKNSEACKQMGNVDLAAMCAKAPEQYRAQCEQQAKQMAGMCQ